MPLSTNKHSEIFIEHVRSRMTLYLIAFLSLFVYSSSSFAVTLIYKSIDDLVNESTNIIKGDVTNITAIKIKDEIFTDILLSNASIITASNVKQTTDITLRMFGGVVNGQGMGYSGTPQFEVGHTIIVFTKRNGIYSVPIIGWEQGILHIDKNNTISDYRGNKITQITGNHFEKNLKKPSPTPIFDDKTKQFISTDKKLSLPGKLLTKSILIRDIQTRLKKRALIFNGIQTLVGSASIKPITDDRIMEDRVNLHELPPVIHQSEKSHPKHAHKF